MFLLNWDRSGMGEDCEDDDDDEEEEEEDDDCWVP